MRVFQVVKESDGGYKNHIYPTPAAAADQRLLECWTPFAVHLAGGAQVASTTAASTATAEGEESQRAHDPRQADGPSDDVTAPAPAAPVEAVAVAVAVAATSATPAPAADIAADVAPAAPAEAVVAVPKQLPATTVAAADTEATPTAPAPVSVKEQKPSKPLRLLHVDDSVPVQRLMGKWLRSEGCVVSAWRRACVRACA